MTLLERGMHMESNFLTSSLPTQLVRTHVLGRCVALCMSCATYI